MVVQNECLCRNSRPRSSLKKVKFHEIHTKTSVRKNETLAQVFSCELCEICKGIFFAEHQRTTASDYISSIEVKVELTNETVNYDTKTKA